MFSAVDFEEEAASNPGVATRNSGSGVQEKRQYFLVGIACAAEEVEFEREHGF